MRKNNDISHEPSSQSIHSDDNLSQGMQKEQINEEKRDRGGHSWHDLASMHAYYEIHTVQSLIVKTSTDSEPCYSE